VSVIRRLLYERELTPVTTKSVYRRGMCGNAQVEFCYCGKAIGKISDRFPVGIDPRNAFDSMDSHGLPQQPSTAETQLLCSLNLCTLRPFLGGEGRQYESGEGHAVRSI
jgi:hypothetical protein